MNTLNLIEDNLKNYISAISPEGFHPVEIYKAMEYSLLSGGKRMRPKLMIYTAEGFGCNAEKVMPYACAMEMIHTYSLIHDDLPAMDDDDYRRGKPTCHKQFGEAIAILAGDALLNAAYETMLAHCKRHLCRNNIYAMDEIAMAAGVRGMIGGQVADIISEDKSVDFDTLLYIQENKTAALIKASMSAGGMLGGADDKDIEKLKEAGRFLGIAFQIKDDLLDIQSDISILGKPTGSDVKNHKATYVSLNGVEKAEADYMDYSNKAADLVNSLGLKTTSLADYIELLTRRNF